MLEDIEHQDLFKWKNVFIQTAKLTQLDEHTDVDVLNISIYSK